MLCHSVIFIERTMEMYDSICDLIVKEVDVSETGDPIETVSQQRTVFCEIVSANYHDKQVAEARGKSADKTVKLADRLDYNDELYLEIDGIEYEVIDQYYDDKSRELRLVVSKWARQ